MRPKRVKSGSLNRTSRASGSRARGVCVPYDHDVYLVPRVRSSARLVEQIGLQPHSGLTLLLSRCAERVR